MTTPTPPAQDGERERLFFDWHDVPANCSFFQWSSRALAMIRADTETIRTQSAELVALRAQVEGLRSALCSVMQEVQRELRGQVAKTIFDLCDAALAPPQPVAKEK